MIDIHSYDHLIVSYSGGKDSTAVVLWLLEQGVSRDKIELWHQCIDADGETFMDWEVTRSYSQKFAEALGLKIYYQWKEGGFMREMLRDSTPTAPTMFEAPDGQILSAGGKGNPDTRLKFPACSANLMVRWCSSYLKIDVCSIALRNLERFRHKRTLVLTGERGEESVKRSKYKEFEIHRADGRNSVKLARHIDHFRPVLHWKEHQVWEIIERHRIRVHPCYYMGWGRCSCQFCIFGNADQFASAAYISPDIARKMVGYEKIFNYTLKPDMDLATLIAKGIVYQTITRELMRLAKSTTYDQAIKIPLSEKWILPAGAYKNCCGPS